MSAAYKRKYRVAAPTVKAQTTHLGGVERYAAWLKTQPDTPFEWGAGSAECPQFGLKARLGGDAVRLGDGVSDAWVEACGRSRWRWRKHLEIERRALKAARHIVAISPMVQAELRQRHGLESRLVLNPVLHALAPRRQSSGELVCVGHGFHRKGVADFLSVLRVLTDRRGVVIGRDAHLSRWRRLAKRAGLSERVRFLGPVDAQPHIQSAALVLAPALYEPYGNVVAEAVAAGRPVVVSDTVGAQCLLDPKVVWQRRSGHGALVEIVRAELLDHTPPRQLPPTAGAHLEALYTALEV